MVMEPPSPQSVGREFVRQYYTLLNRAPLHLHRLYSNNSSFVHGGLDQVPHAGTNGTAGGGKDSEPVFGQQEIHQKIMQLNFRDCHVKIRQVDAHSTLGDGVVVQVSGELSNNGQPMRRFMQTFVLAPQSPKKYYVRNDIFRYQDEVFSEEEPDSDSGLAAESSSALDNSEASVYDKPTEKYVNAGGIATVSAEPPQPQHAPPQQQQQHVVPPPPQQQVHAPPPPQQPQVVPQAQPVPPPPQQQHAPQPDLTIGTGQANQEQPPMEPNNIIENRPVAQQAAPAAAEQVVPKSDDEDEAPAEPSAPTDPPTYANLVKSGPPSIGGGPPAPQAVKREMKEMAAPKPFVPPPSGRGRGGRTGGPGRGGGAFGAPPRSNERPPPNSDDPPSERPDTRPPRTGRPMSISQQYPDSQQLFVGNLPHNCKEENLEALFSKYGKVAEVRISIKGANQTKTLPTGAKVPNFGFVVFEEERSVHECLKHRPIYLPDNHRLNVEEKKNRNRSDGGSTDGGDRPGRPPMDSGRFGSQEALGGRGGGIAGGRGGRGGSLRGRGGAAMQQNRGGYQRRS